jgi:RNA polymerase sigma-70 factor (ECF subfamily)
MSRDQAPEPFPEASRRRFTETHWSVVLAARDGSDSRARLALDTLCRTYWYPIYALVRGRGHSQHDAEDLTQGFFHRLIAKDGLEQVSPAKGRFRHFLLAAIKNFLANEWDKAHTLKRGGDCVTWSLDGLAAEERYATEPVDENSPDVLYDRRWALSLLEHSLRQLREEYSAAGNGPVFETLQECLTPGNARASHAELAERLGKSVEAVAVAVHRLRRRYGECLREQIAHTVADPKDVESEFRDLRAILGG